MNIDSYNIENKEAGETNMNTMIENEYIRERLLDMAENFRLPRYEELPDVGLYLEQVVRYVNRYFSLCMGNEITPSMVSNYVKHKLIPGPKKKSYSADSIAFLIFAGYLKLVSPLEDIRTMEEIQQKSYPISVAYNYFVEEMENMVQYVYGMKEQPDVVGKENTLEKELLHSAVLSVVHKLYLDNYFYLLRQYEEKEAE